MKRELLMNFRVDREARAIVIEREFAAPRSRVWAAWTESRWLDQWWAPRPWQARTKTMDFREGGHWLYAMVGPEGEEHWGRADYASIDPQEAFRATDAFCDSSGNIQPEMPRSYWRVTFREEDQHTQVEMQIRYDDLADLEAILQMGFREGMTAALEQLDELL